MTKNQELIILIDQLCALGNLSENWQDLNIKVCSALGLKRDPVLYGCYRTATGAIVKDVTRSLDDQKEIKPEGWEWTRVEFYNNSMGECVVAHMKSQELFTPQGRPAKLLAEAPTERRARLAAILKVKLREIEV